MKIDSATSVKGARFEQLDIPTKRPPPPHAPTFWQALVGRRSVRTSIEHASHEVDCADCEIEGQAVEDNVSIHYANVVAVGLFGIDM